MFDQWSSKCTRFWITNSKKKIYRRLSVKSPRTVTMKNWKVWNTKSQSTWANLTFMCFNFPKKSYERKSSFPLLENSMKKVKKMLKVLTHFQNLTIPRLSLSGWSYENHIYILVFPIPQNFPYLRKWEKYTGI